MTAPEIRHHAWCNDPSLRRSDVPLDRLRTRWRCLGCGVEAVVTGGTTTWCSRCELSTLHVAGPGAYSLTCTLCGQVRTEGRSR